MTHQDERSLEERLAEKLYNLYGKGIIDLRPWSSIGEGRNGYLILARECIRQMEYTRWQVANSVAGKSSPEFFQEHASQVPLKLAPGDYLP